MSRPFLANAIDRAEYQQCMQVAVASLTEEEKGQHGTNDAIASAVLAIADELYAQFRARCQ